MNVVDIKKKLHAQIEMIDDEAFLVELNDLIQSELGSTTVYKLSPAQLAAIEEGRAEYNAGLGIPHEQVMEEIDAWLGEK